MWDENCQIYEAVWWWWWLLPRLRGFWENCSTIHYLPALFFFFFEVEICLHTLVHSGSASWDDCGRMFPAKVCESSFPDRFPHYVVSPLRLRWVKGVCVFRCNLPPALSAEWLRSFTCHCNNTGVERTPNKSQHTKSTLEKKILLLLLLGFELATFWSRVWRSYHTTCTVYQACSM